MKFSICSLIKLGLNSVIASSANYENICITRWYMIRALSAPLSEGPSLASSDLFFIAYSLCLVVCSLCFLYIGCSLAVYSCYMCVSHLVKLKFGYFLLIVFFVSLQFRFQFGINSSYLWFISSPLSAPHCLEGCLLHQMTCFYNSLFVSRRVFFAYSYIGCNFAVVSFCGML